MAEKQTESPILVAANDMGLTLTTERKNALLGMVEYCPRGPLPFRRHGLHVSPDRGDFSVYWATYVETQANGGSLLVGFRALQDFVVLAEAGHIPPPTQIKAAPSKDTKERAELLGFKEVGPHRQLGKDYYTAEVRFDELTDRLMGPEGRELERQLVALGSAATLNTPS